jgi:hydroxymethylpyrimidine pyrophosphatase-like HAD family hydrolase
MRFLALATDYDGTIAAGGQVGESTFAALEKLRQSGRKVLLVTGREIPDLARVCPRLEAFDGIVAENGALLYEPATRRETPLAAPPPPQFVEALKARNVAPMSVGRVIVATWQPHETAVLETIRDLGLELQVIFNKGAVMILPSGVNKATGLASALELLCLSPHNVVAVGDAENDHALCQACEASAAVANALPTLKDAVDIVLENHHGGGVEELIARIVADDLRSIETRLARHHLLLGHTTDGQEVRLPPYGANVLVTGPRGGGKSSLAAALLDRLAASRYQFCIVDPDGSYEQLAHATEIGQGQEQLDLEAVIQLLSKPNQNAHVSLASVPAAARQPKFADLIVELERLRVRTGRPHWLLVDDAEHLLPSDLPEESLPLPPKFDRIVLITETPRQLSRRALAQVDTVAVVGKTPQHVLAEFCQAVARAVPSVSESPLSVGEALYWRLNENTGPTRIRIKAAQHPTASPSDAPGATGPPPAIRPANALAR